MQLEKLKRKHIAFIEKEFEMSEEEFRTVCEDAGDELDALLDDLMWKECDAADEYEENGEYSEDGLCAIELIDIICGPYNGDDGE